MKMPPSLLHPPCFSKVPSGAWSPIRGHSCHCHWRIRSMEHVPADTLIPWVLQISRPRKPQVEVLDFTEDLNSYPVQALAEGRAKNLSKVQPWIEYLVIMSLSKHKYFVYVWIISSFNILRYRKTPLSRSPGAIRPRRKTAATNPQSLPGFATNPHRSSFVTRTHGCLLLPLPSGLERSLADLLPCQTPKLRAPGKDTRRLSGSAEVRPLNKKEKQNKDKEGLKVDGNTLQVQKIGSW